MKKKIIIIGVVIFLLVALAFCGSILSEDSGSSSSETEQTEIVEEESEETAEARTEAAEADIFETADEQISNTNQAVQTRYYVGDTITDYVGATVKILDAGKYVYEIQGTTFGTYAYVYLEVDAFGTDFNFSGRNCYFTDKDGYTISGGGGSLYTPYENDENFNLYVMLKGQKQRGTVSVEVDDYDSQSEIFLHLDDYIIVVKETTVSEVDHSNDVVYDLNYLDGHYAYDLNNAYNGWSEAYISDDNGSGQMSLSIVIYANGDKETGSTQGTLTAQGGTTYLFESELDNTTFKVDFSDSGFTISHIDTNDSSLYDAEGEYYRVE